MDKVRAFLILLCLGMPTLNYAQKENSHIRTGNDYFSNGDFENAEKAYREAVNIAPDSYKANFNLGDALYKQEKYDEAITNYKIVANTQTDKARVAKAHFNIGNAQLAQQKFDEAIDSYKESLRNNPADVEAKYNLAYAKKMKEQAQNQQQQDNQDKNKDNEDQNKENKDKQDQEQNKDQQNQNDKKDNQQQDQDKNKNQDKKEDNSQNDQQDQQQAPKPDISKENAARMLEALENDEKQTQEKVKREKAKVRKVRIEKDW